MNEIIGRKKEIRILEKLYLSKKAEFLAVYGRRRVGKTFLISRFFRNKCIYFEVTGTKGASKAEQLANFHREYVALFQPEGEYLPPEEWSEAFHRIKEVLLQLPQDKKLVVFFDELPWLATEKSGFLSALDYFWNRHGSRMDHLLLIICGSAASWMIKKIICDKGGLYGRLSAEMCLKPFSMSEVKEYLHVQNIHLPHKQIAEIYMVTGGVPKYLTFIERGQSSSQAINALCFMPQSPLVTEFHKLYDSLFENAQRHVKIVRLLANKRAGLTRNELFKALKMPASGRAMEIVDELVASGFLLEFPSFGKNVKNRQYRLFDEYSLFYLTWIDAEKNSILQGSDRDYWGKRQLSPAWYSWAGYAFESICFSHIGKIKEALEIGGVSTKESYWYCPGEGGAEIDLIIDRRDQCINLCEIKFYSDVWSMSREEAERLQYKKTLFQSVTKTKKALFTTLITPYGAAENSHYLSAVDRQITLNDFI